MSSSVFPSLNSLNLSWPRGKRPLFKTGMAESVSGREVRTAYMLYPKWEFRIPVDALRSSQLEYETLQAFMLSLAGRYESFLFTDPNDSVATTQSFGVGNGTTTQFQLARTFTGSGFTFTEPVANVNVLTNITDNGTPVPAGGGAGQYTINSAGLVTFGTAPVTGHILRWTGTFYFRCRFDSDTPDFMETVSRLWELREMKMIGAPGNKV